MHDQFRRVQDEYFRLRGQFSVGIINEQEFDNALHALSIQDAQGHDWMIGANTGKWYVYDGTQWTEADPFQTKTIAPPPAPDAMAELIAPTAAESVPPRGRGLALPFLLASIILLLVAALAYILFNLDSISFADAESLPTRIPPQTAIAIGTTRVVPTATATRTRAVPTTENVNANTTRIPMTVTPPPLVVEPTTTRPVMTAIPTITPGGPIRNVGDIGGATEPDDFNSEGAPEAKEQTPAAAPPPTQQPGLSPDVYITGLSVSPNPPPQRQDVTFTATFLNTNPNDVGMEWRVVFLDPAKQGRNKDWGQSQLVGVNIPPGRHTHSLTFSPVTSSGPCITLQVLVARGLPDGGRFFLPSTSGGAFATTMTFC